MVTKRQSTVKTAEPPRYCVKCGRQMVESQSYKSNSVLHSGIGKMPYCKECVDKIYNGYVSRYEHLKCADPEKKAVERMCMILDIYYSDKVVEMAEKNRAESNTGVALISFYMRMASLAQYNKKSYDSTIEERYAEDKKLSRVVSIYDENDAAMTKSVDAAVKLFGAGFDNDDYIFLYDQYCDWTARHECNTKAQEEVFKNICITQLQLHKAILLEQDTKDLSAQLQKWLDTGKLQPKQNSSDTVAENQTFGTLIDKWENTRPIPEVDEELKDVDKIGLYIDVFFRGHLAKMAGIKNALSNLYSDFMKKYTVEKPEYYNDDDDYEPLFDAVFGKPVSDED